MNAVITIFIYKILNKIDGKFYIGSTCSIDRRFKEHKRDLNNGKHHSIYLQRAWDKYGEDAFVFEVIHECFKEEVRDKEQYFLDHYRSYNYRIGYNMNRKVDSREGRSMSLESRMRMSNSKKGRPSPRLGSRMSEEAKKKSSLSHKNQKAWNKGMVDVYSEEAKYQMGKGRRGKSSWNAGKKTGPSWNNGLTKETDERIAKTADSKEVRLKRSIAVTKWWKQRKEVLNGTLL